MFLPDSDLTQKDYLKKYDIKLVEVYSDLIDEFGVDNQNSLYKNKRTYFKTISSCYSFTNEEMCEMWIMNLAENKLLEQIYPMFEQFMKPNVFGKYCFDIISSMEEFPIIFEQVKNLLDPKTEAQNIKRLNGRLRNLVVDELIENNKPIIISEMFKFL